MPKRPAVLLQLEEAALLPGPGADLDQLAAHQQELQVGVSLQTWTQVARRGQGSLFPDDTGAECKFLQ